MAGAQKWAAAAKSEIAKFQNRPGVRFGMDSVVSAHNNRSAGGAGENRRPVCAVIAAHAAYRQQRLDFRSGISANASGERRPSADHQETSSRIHNAAQPGTARRGP